MGSLVQYIMFDWWMPLRIVKKADIIVQNLILDPQNRTYASLTVLNLYPGRSANNLTNDNSETGFRFILPLWFPITTAMKHALVLLESSVSLPILKSFCDVPDASILRLFKRERGYPTWSVVHYRLTESSKLCLDFPFSPTMKKGVKMWTKAKNPRPKHQKFRPK